MTLMKILAVYQTYPVMIVVEAEDGSIIELSLNELAEVYELLPHCCGRSWCITITSSKATDVHDALAATSVS